MSQGIWFLQLLCKCFTNKAEVFTKVILLNIEALLHDSNKKTLLFCHENSRKLKASE